MKTILSLFVFLCAATVSFSQQKTVLSNAYVAKSADGSPCVQLAWKKGDDQAAYYLVERSSDGKEFKQIALVFASEDAAFSDYKYKDKVATTAGSSMFYRISVVNSQKEISYLPVRKVDLATANQAAMALVTPESTTGTNE